MARSHAKAAVEKPKEEEHPRPRAGRPMWSGSISFGLVNIPVRLYAAIRAKDVRFHLLHARDKARLQEKLVCPADQQEVPRQEAVRGFEISQGQHVIVSQEEMDSLAPKASRTIELVSVVPVNEIDPMFFDRPYYLLPDEKAGKAYALLIEALRQSKRGAIIKFVMRNKEYIGALRPVKNVLCLDTLHFADEIIAVDHLPLDASATHPQLRDAEVKMALQLLEALAADFKPEQLHDDYREAVLNLVKKKAEGQEIETPPMMEEKAPQVIDLMAALKKSIEQAQKHKGRQAA